MRQSSTKSALDKGFTLVEMLVTLVVSTILMALIMTAYWGQTRSSRDKQMTVGMQQNMRSAMFNLERDIRMAGYDPDFQDLTNATSIVTATAGVFSYRYFDDDSGTIETITYSLNPYPGVGNSALRKQVNTTPADDLYIAQDIERLEFYYRLEDGTWTLNPADPNDVRAVGVSILARGRETSLRPETVSFTSLSGATWGPYTDGIRRQILTTTVKCRNMFNS